MPGAGVLKPGEETTILVQMDTRRFTGTKTVTIFVTYGQPYTEVRLWVQANSVEEEVAPQAAPGPELPATPARAEADTHASLRIELLQTFQHAIRVLRTVKDEDSAQSALPNVKKIAEAITDLKKRAEKLGPDPKYDDRYFTEWDAACYGLYQECSRVSFTQGPRAKEIYETCRACLGGWRVLLR
jgi:hypothetical protein